MSETKIEWADMVWNPVTGCSKISVGCDNCYAEVMARRLRKMCPDKYGNGFGVTCHEGELLRRFGGKGKRIFVCSMGDLFHEEVPFDFIIRVLVVIIANPQHTFMWLTKRAERMREFCDFYGEALPDNLWLGVTVENQVQADRRIPHLLGCEAVRRFVSVEPMLGAVVLVDLHGGVVREPWLNSVCDVLPYWSFLDRLDWVICGGGSGPGARPLHPDWVRKLRDQCGVANVPFFFKQWGEWMAVDQPWAQDIVGELGKNERWLIVDGFHGFHGTDVWRMRRVGKGVSGRLIDGVSYMEVP